LILYELNILHDTDPIKESEMPGRVDEVKWNRAKAIVRGQKGGVNNKYALVNHIYQNMGGTFHSTKKSLGDSNMGSQYEKIMGDHKLTHQDLVKSMLAEVAGESALEKKLFRSSEKKRGKWTRGLAAYGGIGLGVGLGAIGGGALGAGAGRAIAHLKRLKGAKKTGATLAGLIGGYGAGSIAGGTYGGVKGYKKSRKATTEHRIWIFINLRR
jgi:hypothetical protein